VSLILEALKKLEREKKTSERGFLVTTRAAWPASGSHPLASLATAAVLLGVGALGTWLVLGGSGQPRQAERSAPPSPVTRTEPAAQTSPTALTPVFVPLPTSVSRTYELVTPPSPAPRRLAPTPAPKPSEEPSPEPSGPAELRLEALSQRDGHPIAVVSGHLVREGDVFDNVRVLRIGEGEVEIEVDGKRRVLAF
jgi:hypothetical protein